MKKYIPVIPVLILLLMGALNIYEKITWKEPTDGVRWEETPEGQKGLIAAKIEVDSHAYLQGIKKGDILYKINDIPVNNKIDVAKKIYRFGKLNQRVIYQIYREGEPLFNVSFFLEQKGTELIYFYLALIGLTALVIGLIIFFNTRQPLSSPYLFFFLISVVFYSFSIFSPTGKLDFLDSSFYWLDKIAFLVFPPLLLHFFLVFSGKKKTLEIRPFTKYLIYFPCVALLFAKVFMHSSDFFRLNESFLLKYYEISEKIDLLHFAVFSLIAFAVILIDTLKTSDPIIKKQLKWITYGLGFGILPFVLFYIFPFLLGNIPSRTSELTIVLQALVPLTFAYSISRYKRLDLEVLLKKAIPLITSYVFIAILYFIVSSQTKIIPENRLNALILGILAIVLGATLFTPLKKLIQSLLDILIYKRSYKYRKTLLSITQELSRERSLQKLSQSILDLIGKALSLKYIALLLPIEQKKGTLFIQKSWGNLPSQVNQITIKEQIFEELKNIEYISTSPFERKKSLTQKFHDLISLGFFHIMPLTVEDKLIGCIGMGKKKDNTFLNAEDWELLQTISSPVALALENAYLYNQANIRALELERLKDYSENIIESLTVGVAVLDRRGQIIGWNRVLEDQFVKTKKETIGKKLISVLGKKNFTSIYPSDTQQDLNLLSEVTLEMPSGQKRLFDISKTPLLDNQMNPYGTVIAFEDITEKIALQHQLLTSEKLASIGLLSAGVAHEINTPLTGISSYVQILQKKLSGPHYTKLLEKIETQTERVARIIKNLLNFARNPSEASFHRVNLKENLEEILSLIDYKLKNMNIKLELNLNSTQSIWAQGERLQQVFINIILNAIDAMPGGGTLKIHLFQTDNTAVVKIEDTGTGIKAQHLPHIFDPFFTTRAQGTGLGLSIVHRLLESYGGRIDVKSTEGQGTLFILYLKRIDSPNLLP